MPSDPLPPPRDPAPVGSAVNLGSQGSSSVQTHMGPHGDVSFMSARVMFHEYLLRQDRRCGDVILAVFSDVR